MLRYVFLIMKNNAVTAQKHVYCFLSKETSSLEYLLLDLHLPLKLRATLAKIVLKKENVEKIGRFELWPVPVNNGFSAFFTDPNYKNVFGVEHQALDIPTAQGTGIIAPGNAVVLKAVDNGFGYSYIALAHENGLVTVYGHVSTLLVKEGDYVEKGQIFALSGGTPGTLGAGYRTTGAHLHLEIHCFSSASALSA